MKQFKILLTLSAVCISAIFAQSAQAKPGDQYGYGSCYASKSAGRCYNWLVTGVTAHDCYWIYHGSFMIYSWNQYQCFNLSPADD